MSVLSPKVGWPREPRTAAPSRPAVPLVIAHRSAAPSTAALASSRSAASRRAGGCCSEQPPPHPQFCEHRGALPLPEAALRTTMLPGSYRRAIDVLIYTSSWFTPLPLDFVKIGISRGVPRNQPPGYRRIHSLEPGPWFRVVSPEAYHELYMTQLAKLDAAAILREIAQLGQAADRVALVCYESPTDPDAWCHRGQVAAWLSDELILMCTSLVASRGVAAGTIHYFTASSAAKRRRPAPRR